MISFDWLLFLLAFGHLDSDYYDHDQENQSADAE